MTIVKSIVEKDINRLFAEAQRIIALTTDIGGWKLKCVKITSGTKGASALICFNVETGNKFPTDLFHC